MYCNCYRTNPASIDFTIDYWAMCDSLKVMMDYFDRANTPLPIEFEQLHAELTRLGPNLRVAEFSQAFANTITPAGEEPTFTFVYHLIKTAMSTPADPTSAPVLRWVVATRKIIRIFDNAKARDVQQLTFALMEMKQFVTDLLDDIHTALPPLNAQGREALTNMERWKTSMGVLTAQNLTLARLNEFIGVLQPTQPFAMSVYLLYQYIVSPVDAQDKAMKFMAIITKISDLINPFTQEFAANDELTGWKYLHVPAPTP